MLPVRIDGRRPIVAALKEDSMIRHSVLTGIAAVLLACAMSYSGDAHAGWRPPKTPCNASNIGTTATTLSVIYNANGTYAYTDHATFMCTGGAWALIDVTRCFPNGNCVPL
jgi:hypothetical protein